MISEQHLPRSTAREEASSTVLLNRLKRLVTENPHDSFGIPGAIFAVAGPTGSHKSVSLGVDAQGNPIDCDSLFPLASTSKLALGLLILGLIDEGALSLDVELRRYLPDAAASFSPGVTIRTLLSHTSGLPLEIRHELSKSPGTVDWRSELRWPGELAAACLQTPLATSPGAYFQYSNVGYGPLALAAERVTGSISAALIQQRVAVPLQINLLLGIDPPSNLILTPHRLR